MNIGPMRLIRRSARLATVAFLLLGCDDNATGTNNNLAEKIVCPAPAIAEVEPWAKSGTQQVCKIKHGPFVAWEAGYVHVRGQYENGRESGVWRWYDSKGNVVKEMVYSSGQ